MSPTRVAESLMTDADDANESAGVHFDSYGRRLSTSCSFSSSSSSSPPIKLASDKDDDDERIDEDAILSRGDPEYGPPSLPHQNLGLHSSRKWTFLEQMLEEGNHHIHDGELGEESSASAIVQLKRLCKYHGWAWSLVVVPTGGGGREREDDGINGEGDSSSADKEFLCTIVVRGSVLWKEQSSSKSAAVRKAVDVAVARLLAFLCPEASTDVKATGTFFDTSRQISAPSSEIIVSQSSRRKTPEPSELELSVSCQVRDIIVDNMVTNVAMGRCPVAKILRGSCLAIILQKKPMKTDVEAGVTPYEVSLRDGTVIAPVVVVVATVAGFNKSRGFGNRLENDDSGIDDDVNKKEVTTNINNSTLFPLLRRCLQRYLLSEVEKFHEGKPSIICQDDSTELLAIKSNCLLHLVLFSGMTANDGNTSNMPHRDAHLEKWRQLGAQGSFLSHIFKPIFFRSVIDSGVKLSSLDQSVNDQSVGNEELVGEVASTVAVAWTTSGNHFEMLDASNQKLLHPPEVGMTSAVSFFGESALLTTFKNLMYENDYAKYKRLFLNRPAEGVGGFMKRVKRGSEQNSDRTFEDIKKLAIDYNLRKKHLFGVIG